jgi:solute carrier family 39 (zinc transporter), member 1/2/3
MGQVVSPAAVATMCRGGHLHSSAATAATTVEAVVAAVTPHNIPLNAWKIMFQVFLTALNVACWLIPLKSKRISQNKLALSLANAFSGGVFLSLAFGHLIPECLHGFADGNYNEAAPFVLVLAGYLLIFFVEKVAFDAHDILHEMEHAGGQQHNHVHHAPPPKIGADKAVIVNGSNAAPAITAAETTAASSTGRSAVILLGALAIHSILEMMALGLANTFGDCALLTLSISLHQPAESIALLVAFLKSGLSESQIITYLSIFSCMGPIGVGLGMLVNEYAAPIVDSIMLAVVAGTFVYVGATEVIPEEWEDSTHKWKKFFALMSGIVSILCITQYTMALGH